MRLLTTAASRCGAGAAVVVGLIVAWVAARPERVLVVVVGVGTIVFALGAAVFIPR
ncbi:MAG: hypothetical protein M3P34_00395 [Actinomycetota bacterium]|nr:hypothetical protein [Actinomycetota bacterium]